MNCDHIKKSLEEIDRYIDMDSYVLSQSKRNQIHNMVKDLLESIEKEYKEVKDTMIYE